MSGQLHKPAWRQGPAGWVRYLRHRWNNQRPEPEQVTAVRNAPTIQHSINHINFRRHLLTPVLAVFCDKCFEVV
jgi:hypothetical protein